MFPDLKLAIRQLARSPGFTFAAVASLALGLGATATVLCWLNHLVERPLAGVTDQQELVMLVSNQGGGNVSVPDLDDFVAQGGVFSDALVSMPTPASLTVGRQSEWVNAQIISANAFDLLGVKPILGRAFLPGEDRKAGASPVLVISERLWRRRFGGSAAVLGRTVELNRHAFTIVGVAPASFLGTVPPKIIDAWAPSSMIWEVRNQGTGFLTQRSWRGWLNLARLRPGVSIAQAQAAVEALGARLTATYPNTNRDVHHRVVPLSGCPWSAAAVVGPVLRLLLVVCGGVLLIVAGNIASLLLARAVGRRKEIAIRLSAGASRARLVRQFLTESILLGLLGGLAGLVLASWAIDTLPLLLTEPSPDLALQFSLDGRIAALTLALSLATGIAFGLLPAWQASQIDLNEVLKECSRGTAGSRSAQRARRLLVAGEIALALVLLAGASLCLRGLSRARQVDFGFQPDHVLLAGMRIGMNGYTPATGPQFYRQVRERLAALPGVEEAALASWIPLGLSGCKGTGVQVAGYVRPPNEDATYEFAIVSPRYFAAMRIPLVAGRDFTDRDDAAAPPVAIVNEVFANRFWPGQDPLGRKFRSGGNELTIVGIARTGKYNQLNEPPACFFYVPYQMGAPDLDLGLCVRTRGDPLAAVPAIRQAVAALDPGVDLLGFKPLTTHVEAVFFAQWVASLFLTLLGGVALALAALGVYAVMAFAVNQRTQEFGVRLALGASAGQVLWLVVRQGLALTGAGVAAGVVTAFGLTHLLSSFLYGTSPFDPLTFLAVPAVLGLVALLASCLPAWRATRVNPMEALRAE
ncbi:MAG TPA: ABC transporter permease [Lacunisphaera sp.]|jgi:predicted permease|nr:ABC transporter permease [Lacunisphaera sp.]